MKVKSNPIRTISRLAFAVLFLVAAYFYANAQGGGQMSLTLAAVIGAYMALNIGANDVANNMGPAVGAKAMTMLSAIIIAAIFEAGGAIIAGGDVVSTIKDGIINPEMLPDAATFIWLMTGALLAAALWLNIATAMGAPVSTTHSIVGGVLGAGVAAGGLAIADWGKLGQIAASWVISPVLGGLIAAGFLYVVKRSVMYKPNMIEAAKVIVPRLVAFMAFAFATYLMLKGLKKIIPVSTAVAFIVGAVTAAVAYVAVRPLVSKAADRLGNDKGSINTLFNIPLIFSAALLSFAHGANDVANAIGPLAAINEAVMGGDVAAQAAIPLWVMLIGALGIAVGLMLYGPKLIRTVGSEITELDQSRAFCIAMSAAITVIVASQLGLPVSSTHIAVGAVFGVGFLREMIKANYHDMIEEIRHHHQGSDKETVDRVLSEFETATIEEKGALLKSLKAQAKDAPVTKRERKSLRKVYRKDLVKRSMLYRIAAAWVITVPASALMGALFFYAIRGMSMPGI